MRTILITGSSGFLGSSLVIKALSEGYRVVGIDKKSPTLKPHGEFIFLETDVNKLDFEVIPKLDFIIHTASSLPYGNSQTEFDENNVSAAIAIAHFAKKSQAFLVEIGSSSVYGKPVEVPVTRQTPIAPLDSYARSKLKAETEISRIVSPNQYAVIRPRTILGAGRSGIFDIFFGLVRKGYPLPLANSGRQIIQFVHVEDLARLSLYLGKNKVMGIWPAASPNPKDLRSYLMEVSREFGIDIRYFPINPKVFSSLGNLAFKFKFTKFTPWHFGAFPYDNFVEPSWVPEGFEYKLTCQDSFNDTFKSGKPAKKSPLGKIKIGKKL